VPFGLRIPGHESIDVSLVELVKRQAYQGSLS
jgi:hypothetical protein